MKNLFKLTILFLVLLVISSCGKKADKGKMEIKFGVLPVMQALPVFVAQELNYYQAEGLDVELVSFNTAADKDIAMASGSIDGQFADIFTPLVIESNGQDITIVATNYTTKNDRRMFAIVGRPGASITNLNHLVGIPIALSSNTVLHYVTSNLMNDAGITDAEINILESKNIGMRFQMLMTGQVEAAALPEPLVTMAQQKGAVVFADDAGLTESQTVLLFSAGFLKRNDKAVKSFLGAVQKAQEFINDNPDKAREYMVNHTRLPEPLKETYPVPKFPKLTIPQKDQINKALQWLGKRNTNASILTYSNLVDDRYLP